MRKKLKTVHFTVEPDGITRLIRDVWAEGSFEKALNILKHMACGVTIPHETQYDILRGKKRFANYKGDPDQFCIVKDNWKPRDVDYYPDPEPSKLAAYLKKRADEELELQHSRMMRGEYVEEELEPEILKHKQEFDFSKMKRFAGFDTLEQMNQALLIQSSIPTIDETVAAMHSRDERDGHTPQPDKKLEAESGWLLPDGKYYACLTKMEHVWLAGQFGKTERQAEDAGWIKINKGLLGDTNILHFNNQPPTQKQLNTLFDWCQKHKKPMPDWTTE